MKIFIELIITNNDDSVRQIAAVVLRRNLMDLMEKNDVNTRTQIKNYLINSLNNEKNKVVRKAIANLVLAIAKDLEEDQTWNELLE